MNTSTSTEAAIEEAFKLLKQYPNCFITVTLDGRLAEANFSYDALLELRGLEFFIAPELVPYAHQWKAVSIETLKKHLTRVGKGSTPAPKEGFNHSVPILPHVETDENFRSIAYCRYKMKHAA